MAHPSLKEFSNLYSLKNLIKNPDNPNVVVLVVTNRPRSFCNSDIQETGLSDFHKLTLTVLKTYFQKWLTIEITRIFQMNSFVQI